MTDEKQLTLGDCKPGQIVKLGPWPYLLIHKFEGKNFLGTIEKVGSGGGGEPLGVPISTPLNEVLYVTTRNFMDDTPCRLATQDELDQLAERIKRAND